MKKYSLMALLLLTITSLTQTQDNNLTVIGLGRLGLCMALCFEHAGFNVLGVDIAPEYVECINNKTVTSQEPLLQEYLKTSKQLKATTSLQEGIDFSDTYFIVVDTPSSPYDAYDHSKLSRLLSTINNCKVRNKHIVICCTVFPGYCDNIASMLLKDCTNVSISYNPEFIAQGTIIHNFEHPDIILIGQGSVEGGDRLATIYSKVSKSSPHIMRMSPSSAEITKLAINCFITTKIAFANMIGDIADQTPGANKYDMLKAIGFDSRIGSKCLMPGYGFGGPCFPRDNRALGTYAQKVGIKPIIPFATDRANKVHAIFMAEQLKQQKLDVHVFEDVNYKDNCPVVIIEESQKLAVAYLLATTGHHVVIKDKAEVIQQVKEKYGNIFEYQIINIA